MRFALFITILALALPLPLQAKKKDRKPAGKMPSRVVTLVCRQDDQGPDSAVGLARLTVDLRDSNRGNFGLTIYLRNEQGYDTKTLHGSYTTVPGGYVLRARWNGLPDRTLVDIHAHSEEKTSLPGFAEKQGCGITGELESL